MKRAKPKFLTVLLIVICLVSAASVFAACTPKPAEEPDEKTFEQTLEELGKRLDRHYNFYPSSQFSFDFDVNLAYVPDEGAKGEAYTHRMVLKGNASIGTEYKDGDKNDFLYVLQDVSDPGHVTELSRISNDGSDSKLYVSGPEERYQFDNVNIFKVFEALVGTLGAEADLVTMMPIFTYLCNYAGPLFFDHNDFEYTGTEFIYYLDLEELVGMIADLGPLLEGFLDTETAALIAAFFGAEDITGMLDSLPAIKTKVVFKFSGEGYSSDFLGIELRDAEYMNADKSDTGKVTFTTNNLAVKSGTVGYSEELPLIPPDFDQYQDNEKGLKIMNTDTAGKIFMKNAEGDIYGALDWELVSDFDLCLFIENGFDIKSRAMKDAGGMIHLRVFYDASVSYDTGYGVIDNSLLAKNRASYATDPISENAKVSLLDIVYDPSNTGGNEFLMSFNALHILPETVLDALFDEFEAAGKASEWDDFVLGLSGDHSSAFLPDAFLKFTDEESGDTGEEEETEPTDLALLLRVFLGIYVVDTGMPDSFGVNTEYLLSLLDDTEIFGGLSSRSLTAAFLNGEGEQSAEVVFRTDKDQRWGIDFSGYDAYRSGIAYHADGTTAKYYNLGSRVTKEAEPESDVLTMSREEFDRLSGSDFAYAFRDENGTLQTAFTRVLKVQEAEGEGNYIIYTVPADGNGFFNYVNGKLGFLYSGGGVLFDFPAYKFAVKINIT